MCQYKGKNWISYSHELNFRFETYLTVSFNLPVADETDVEDDFFVVDLRFVAMSLSSL